VAEIPDESEALDRLRGEGNPWKEQGQALFDVTLTKSKAKLRWGPAGSSTI